MCENQKAASHAWRLLALAIAWISFGSDWHLVWSQEPASGPEVLKVRKIAFLVGVDEYDKAGFRRLRFAENDVTSLAAVLRKNGFEAVLLLGSGSGDAIGTRANIWKQFLEVSLPRLKGLNKGDIALFAFAGHGRHREAEGGIEAHYFCPRDANDGDPSTWVSFNELIDEVERFSGSDCNLFLIDCCRDNPSRGRGADGKGFQLKKDIVSILYASSYGEEAFELPDDYRLPAGHPLAGKDRDRSVQHGLFTYFVLEALEEGLAADSEGLVTWDTMANHVKKWVTRESERLIDKNSGKTQRPNMIGSAKGESPVLVRLEPPPLAATGGQPAPKEQAAAEPEMNSEEVGQADEIKVNETYVVSKSVGQGNLFLYDESNRQAAKRSSTSVFYNVGDVIKVKEISAERVKIALLSDDREGWIERDKFRLHMKRN